ncbi:uncharacterized protein LOC143037350 [Oratosquilla oratoria]|uniref:uncharacterized protein LOC143037350 n=1 Tax=Oratosquilla oratoria TaxID=337810 RepID=UPI003F766C0D
MAEHNMPFHQADHLVDVPRKAFSDSEIAKDVTLKKTKASYIIQDHGIAWNECQEIVDICKENKFSLIIDKSTNVSVSQILALVVRFYDKKRLKVTDALLDTKEVEDGSAKGLYSAVKEVFSSKGIPMENIIRFASYNCSTMLGANNGFQAFLKKVFPLFLSLDAYAIHLHCVPAMEASQHFKLGTLYSTISDKYRSILGLFVQDVVIESRKLSEIDPSDETLHKSLEDLCLGGRCEGLMEKNSLIAMLKVVEPAEALSTKRDLKSLGKFAVHFPTLIKVDELDLLQE